MDLTFHCPHCKQELAVDASATGQTIQCPTCNAEITVPQADITNIHVNPIASSAAEILIATTKEAEEPVAADGPKKMKLRVIRHTDCIELGRDRYEEMVGNFLNRVGEENIISITPVNYTHIDIATQKILTDYAVQVIYRG